MRVTVSADDSVVCDSVIVVVGRDDAGNRVTFAGDRRVVVDLLAAAQEYGEVVAEIEPWQVLGISAEVEIEEKR